ncbi:MAG TPA: YbjN domain-containing protein [Kofleriaceae bacterium]|nr:YbjN domain-containing protein [Kofleriaceae bacterium]
MAQALFANQREANLASTVALIEAVLDELGYGAGKSPIPPGEGELRAWRIRKGSATTTIALIERPDFTHVRIAAVVMTLDAAVDRAALFGHLLEINARLCGNAFALDRDRVLLVAERSTLDLDRSEVADLLTRVATNADNHDDALVARFGGTLGAT